MRTGRPRRVSDQAIFEAVGGVVADAGPSGLTLAAVAGRVGLSAPALTQRFGTKRNLLLAYAAWAADGVDDVFRRARAASPTALASLRSALLGLTTGVRSRAALANSVAFLHLDLTDPEFGIHAATQSRNVRRGIARLLEDAMAEGDVGRSDVTVLADTVYTVYSGALVTWAIDGRGSLRRWLATRLDRTLAHHAPR